MKAQANKLKIKKHMQENLQDQNNQQVEQNKINQSVLTSKETVNYLIIIIVVLVCFVVFGFGGYYFGKKSVQTQNANNTLPTPNITNLPTQSATPTTPLTLPDDTTKNWKIYSDEQYGFTFRHPNLDESCCNISGPLTGKPQRIVVLADKSTGAEGTDKPFNGIGIYVEPNTEKITFQNYVIKQKESFLQNYREFGDKEPVGYEESSIVIDGRSGVLLKKYAWWADMIYIPFPNNQKILILAKTEATRGEFDSVFNQILSTLKFVR